MASQVPDDDTQKRVAAFLARAHAIDPPPAVMDAARLCLADWLGVALGGASEPAAQIVHRHVRATLSAGPATLLAGGSAPALGAALANGTAAHCLDFDDTHVGSITHVSAPLWAAVLAAGEARLAAGVTCTGQDLLRSYLAGFQVAARVGAGLGEAVTARGWHSTGVFGRIAAASGCAAMNRLDARACAHALGLAATQAGGLTASFGTMAKPFHAGKAASDGLLAAALAAEGFEAATEVIGAGGLLEQALVQDRSLSRPRIDVEGEWEVLNNSVKPYAACHLTHPAIDAARSIASVVPPEDIVRVDCKVGALAKQVTASRGRPARTALEAKFDLAHCVALALTGRSLSADDFREPWTSSALVAQLAARVQIDADPVFAFASARVSVLRRSGDTVERVIDPALGHPGNPLGWDGMREKFVALTTPGLGEGSVRLFEALQRFGQGTEWTDLCALIRAHTESPEAGRTR